MGDLPQRFDVTGQGLPPGGPGSGGILAKVGQAVLGGVALVGTVVAGALMGGALLVVGSVLAVFGLAAGLYLRWKLRRIIRDQAKQMGGIKPGEPFGQSGSFSGNLGGGHFQIFVHESGPMRGPEAPAEEPLDVEIVKQEDQT